jgi:hypothetical protein
VKQEEVKREEEVTAAVRARHPFHEEISNPPAGGFSVSQL